jgi:hypothetical protein
MSDVTHYLITRFNVIHRKWKPYDKNQVATLTPYWMEQRFELFEKYTLPSILRQKVSRFGFEWIVLLDFKTHSNYRQRLEDRKCITPLYCKDRWYQRLHEYLKRKCRTKWIITTRIDNDDALEPDAIHDIQSQFNERRCFVNLMRGSELNLLYDPPTIEPKVEKYNHFISYIEPTRSCYTVYRWPHGKRLKKIGKVLQLTAKPYWMRVIHERNYLND